MIRSCVSVCQYWNCKYIHIECHMKWGGSFEWWWGKWEHLTAVTANNYYGVSSIILRADVHFPFFSLPFVLFEWFGGQMCALLQLTIMNYLFDITSTDRKSILQFSIDDTTKSGCCFWHSSIYDTFQFNIEKKDWLALPNKYHGVTLMVQAEPVTRESNDEI